MAETQLIPNGIYRNEWAMGANYKGTIVASGFEDSLDVWECHMQDLPPSGTIMTTNLRLWIFGHRNEYGALHVRQPTLNLFCDGKYLGEKTAAIRDRQRDNPNTWTSYNWGGLGLSTVDDLRIWIRAGDMVSITSTYKGMTSTMHSSLNIIQMRVDVTWSVTEDAMMFSLNQLHCQRLWDLKEAQTKINNINKRISNKQISLAEAQKNRAVIIEAFKNKWGVHPDDSDLLSYEEISKM
jgi:hypothetical protein